MIDLDYVEIYSQGIWSAQEVRKRAEEQARGCYQRDLLNGDARLSGSELRGKARKYKARYQRSIENLLDRVAASGVKTSERRGKRGKRILVLGAKR